MNGLRFVKSGPRRRMMRPVPVVLSLLLFGGAIPTHSAGKHGLTFDDLMKMERLSDPQISPDGK